ncbi:DUF1816 domain-containing protein [Nodosilinea sp. FACHB-131]|nr:DUF1816 domain-containing protein [Nodosilinea sp. FACHB-131]
MDRNSYQQAFFTYYFGPFAGFYEADILRFDCVSDLIAQGVYTLQVLIK